MDARTCADGAGAREKVEVGGEKDQTNGFERVELNERVRTVWVQEKTQKWMERRTGGLERAWVRGHMAANEDARTCADCAGAREKVEVGGEKDRWA